MSADSVIVTALVVYSIGVIVLGVAAIRDVNRRFKERYRRHINRRDPKGGTR